MIIHAGLMKSYGHQVKVIIQNDVYDKHGREIEILLGTSGIEFSAARYEAAICMEELDYAALTDNADTLRGLINGYGPDIIHSLQLNPAVELLAREMNIPHIMSVYQISDGMFNIKWDDIFPRYHTADSRFYCEKWENGLGLTSRCIRVVYDDRAGFKEKTISMEQGITAISIGLFSEHKQQMEILKFALLCKLHNLNVRVIFLGDINNSYGDKCRYFVEENGLDEQVIFQGLVTDIGKYLAKADLLINASRSESYPGVIVEAMANHIPVLTTSVAGIPELIHDGVNGILTNGPEYTDIFEAFTRFTGLVKYDNATSIAENAYSTYQQYHTPRIVGEELEKYYQDILSEHSRRENISGYDMKDTEVYKYYKEHSATIRYDYTKKHIWYIYHISKTIAPARDAVIWGVGAMGVICKEWCEILGVNIAGYVDFREKGEFLGHTILTPALKILKAPYVIFIAMDESAQINYAGRMLNRMGKLRNVDYFYMVNSPVFD